MNPGMRNLKRIHQCGALNKPSFKYKVSYTGPYLFDWGGLLLKSNGGAQRYPQHGRTSCNERKYFTGENEHHCYIS